MTTRPLNGWYQKQSPWVQQELAQIAGMLKQNKGELLVELGASTVEKVVAVVTYVLADRAKNLAEQNKLRYGTGFAPTTEKLNKKNRDRWTKDGTALRSRNNCQPAMAAVSATATDHASNGSGALPPQLYPNLYPRDTSRRIRRKRRNVQKGSGFGHFSKKLSREILQPPEPKVIRSSPIGNAFPTR